MLYLPGLNRFIKVKMEFLPSFEIGGVNTMHLQGFNRMGYLLSPKIV